MLFNKRKFLVNIIIIFNLLVFIGLSAQTDNAVVLPQIDIKDTDSVGSFTEPVDTLYPLADTLASVADSIAHDSLLQKPKKKAPLEDIVTYNAKDSLVFSNGNMAYLYGDGDVKYQTIELQAAEIIMNLDSSTVFATGVPDSTGMPTGTPIFTDNGQEYKAKTINYNFKSTKGFINNLVTQQGEGYLTGGQTKKIETDEFYMVNAKYTTCDHHDCPHFYLQLTKAKVKPKKNIVTGPAYLVMADVPLPIAIPFGYFPFTDTYSSGIIMPTYGDELSRGFYLRDGGYYFALNDYIDLALTGEIFTKGSWGLNARSVYAKRYKYNGNFNLGYQVTITGDKGLPDYAKMTNFKVNWTHSQDSKANPNMTLSASVNFATSGYDRNNLDSYYNANQFTENTKSSTVNLSYNFPDSPFSLSTSMNVTQRSADSTLAVSFPDLTLNMSRIYPFKRKEAIGKERWYEKISMNYTGIFRNSLTAQQDEFFKKSLVKDWRNGMQHSVPISASFSLFKYFNITPSVSFTDRMYTNKIMRSYDPLANEGVGAEVADTLYGFYNVYNFNASVSLNTKLYGFYKPLPFLGDKVQMIRHMFTPSISISGQPDFSEPMWGMYETFSRPVSSGSDQWQDVVYSPYSHGLFGTAPKGKSGTVRFDMQHNVEAKIRSNRDSTGVRKISIIDNLSMGTSYNFAADSMRWSDIATSVRFKVTKGFTLQISGALDPYYYSEKGTPINTMRWEKSQFPDIRNASTSFSYTFNNEVIRKLIFGEKKEGKSDPNPPIQEGYESLDQAIEQSSSTEKESKEQFGEDGYFAWKIPWSLSVSYGLRYGYDNTKFNQVTRRFGHKVTQTLSFSGNLNITQGWSFNFSSTYDFDEKKLSYMNCNITRDMHCWTMSAGFVPVGPYSSYNFSVRVKSSLLSDLKYDKRSSPASKLEWY